MERAYFRSLLLFAGTVLAAWGFFLILRPFLVAIAWALCLAAVTYRPYVGLAARWGRPRLAALVMTLATGLVILVPLSMLLFLAVKEVVLLADEGIAQWLEGAKQALPGVFEWINERLAHVNTNVDEVTKRFGDTAPRLVLGPIAKGAWSILAGLFLVGLDLVVILATQYFIYCEAGRLRRMVCDVSPLTDRDTDRILETLRGTTSAAIKGGLLVALAQGALGTVGFLIIGVRAAVLWGLVMAVLSLLPVGGTMLVWGPVAIYLFAIGDVGSAWFLVGWGLLLVGGIDNLLRPWLTRKTGADVHPMLLFFAVISGIGLFGISGLVFGPILIGLLLTVLQIYREHVAFTAKAPPEGGEPAEPAP